MRTVWVAGLCLLLPAAAAAGPIRLRLDGRVSTAPGDEWVARAVSAVSPAEPVALDPAAPVAVSLLRIAPPDLPSDTPGNPHQGTATYYQSDHFTYTLRLTDVASGESGEVSYSARLHATYAYAGNDTWAGTGYVWLGAAALNVGLGGNLYTVSPQGGRYARVDDPGLFEVYVGGNAPAPLPEPGTLALAAVGMGPVGLWLRRRRTTGRLPS